MLSLTGLELGFQPRILGFQFCSSSYMLGHLEGETPEDFSCCLAQSLTYFSTDPYWFQLLDKSSHFRLWGQSWKNLPRDPSGGWNCWPRHLYLGWPCRRQDIDNISKWLSPAASLPLRSSRGTTVCTREGRGFFVTSCTYVERTMLLFLLLYCILLASLV